MYTAALEQFRLIGPWCGAKPWSKDGNPVRAFELARGTAAKLSGTGTAPGGRALAGRAGAAPATQRVRIAPDRRTTGSR